MQWPHTPYPPGYEPPELGFILLACILTLCFVGIVLYLVFTGRIKIEVKRDQNASPEDLNPGEPQRKVSLKKYESDETS